MGERRRRDRRRGDRLLRAVGQEALALARQASLMARSTARPSPPAPTPGAGTPHEDRPLVVFVHGLMAGPGVFEPLRRRAEARHTLPTALFGYPSWLRFEAAAERLARFLETAGEGRAPLVLVGHSLGGLLARWWLQEHDGARRTRAVLTLATPHAGSRLATRLPGPLAEALRPEGWVVRRLREGEGLLHRVPHRAAVAGLDHLVTPPESAAAAPAVQVLRLPDVTHNALLFRPEVAHLLDATVADATGEGSGATSSHEDGKG